MFGRQLLDDAKPQRKAAVAAWVELVRLGSHGSHHLPLICAHAHEQAKVSRRYSSHIKLQIIWPSNWILPAHLMHDFGSAQCETSKIHHDEGGIVSTARMLAPPHNDASQFGRL